MRQAKPPEGFNIHKMVPLSRRWLLKVFAAVGGSSTLAGRFPILRNDSTNMLKQADVQEDTTKVKAKPHAVVVGAGAFGGWTALYLLRLGARVTLVDAWGPGNSRASSGGETRVIRGTYGPDQPYTKMAARAAVLWGEHEKKWKRQLMHRIGVLWMAAEGDDQFERGSIVELREAGIRFEELSRAEMKSRWPQIYLEDVPWGIFEPDGGFLMARVSCQAVVEGFIAEGGEFRLAAVEGDLEHSNWDAVKLSDGSKLAADAYVFACGPWLGKLLPQAVGARVKATKQDLFFFGAPPGDDRFSESRLPVWGDHRAPFM